MKWTTTLALAAAFAPFALPALTAYDLSLAGGYTTLSMADFNDSNAKDASALKAAGASDSSSSKLSDGTYLALDAAFEVSPGLNFGPRFEYIMASRCTVQGTFSGADYKATNDLSLIPLMLGFSGDLSLHLEGLSLRGGIYGGYAMAKSTVKADNAGAKSGSTASGHCLLGELNAELRYKIIPLLSLGLDLGYRLASVASMADDNSAATWTKSGSTGALPLDFSGANLGASLAFNF